MNFRGLLQNRRFVWALVLFGLITLLILISNLFVLGGDQFFNLSTALLSPAAALLAGFYFYQASLNQKDRLSRPVWLGLAAGFGLWGLADLIWAFYTILRPDAIPFPSIADLVWVAGYAPLYYALIERFKTLHLQPGFRQRWLIIGLNALWIGLASAFILLPVFRDFESSRLLESAVNLIYPLADMGLVVLASLTLSLLRGGRFSLVWRLVMSGIIIMTVSDLLFSYATWNGLYYPGGKVNALTNFIDTSYILAYIFSAFGVYVYRFIWDLEDEFVIRLEALPYSLFYTFLATDRNNQVISTGDNFYLLVNGSSILDFTGRRLDEVFGIRPHVVKELFDRVAREGKILNEPFQIKTLDRQDRKIWVTAEAAYNPDGEFAGANLALSAGLAADGSLRLPKDREVLAMMNYLIELAGSRPEDEIQTLRAYFLGVIRLLASLLYQFGGGQFRTALFIELERAAQQNHLPVKAAEQIIQIPQFQEGKQLASTLLPLLAAARKFAAGVVGEQVVGEEIDELERQLPETARRDLEKYQFLRSDGRW